MTTDKFNAEPLAVAYRPLLDGSPDALLLIASEGKILLANSLAEKLFGYGPNELAGLPAEQLVPKRFLERYHADRKAFFNAPRARSVGGSRRFMALCKDGSELAVEFNVAPLETPSGMLLSTAVRRAPRDLRKSEDSNRERSARADESYFRMLFEEASNAIVVADSKANCIDMNSIACTLLGYSREELIGKSAVTILHPDEIARVAPEIERLQTGEVIETEWRARRKDGQDLLLECVARRLPDGSLQAILRDITERRRVEDEQRRRAEDLEKFHRLSVGRELRMVELKREVNELSRELGRSEPYDVDFAEAG